MEKGEFEKLVEEKNSLITKLLHAAKSGAGTIVDFSQFKDCVNNDVYSRVFYMLVECNRYQITKAMVAIEELESIVNKHCPNDNSKNIWLDYLQTMSNALSSWSSKGGELLKKHEDILRKEKS